MRHNLGGCQACDRQHHILQTIRRSLAALETLREAAGIQGAPAAAASDQVPPATPEPDASSLESVEVAEHHALAVEFADIEEKLHQLVAHLIRTKAQSCFKRHVLEHLGARQFYLLIDYWAKLKPTKYKNATCEGNQKGISCHGAMVIFLNPCNDRRKQLEREHSVVSKPGFWDGFPPPQEDGGPRFVTEHIHLLSNDSKQDVFHTQSVLDATLQDFIKDRPWLNEKRGAYCQSDQAGNYRDPSTEFNQVLIGVRCFSEANEGKDEGDSEAGRSKQALARYRNEGHDTEDETEFYRALQASQEAGGTNGILDIHREAEDKDAADCRKPVANISNYALWTVDQHQNMTFWESLDSAQAAKGNFVGLGSGFKVSAEDFREKHCRQSQPTRARFKRGEEEGTGASRSVAAHYTPTQR